jgi:hypothetical protein
LLWNVNANPLTYISNSKFVSGGTGRAIELGSTVPTSISFQSMAFTGYSTYVGSGASDAVYNNSGGTITLQSLDSVFNLFTTAITLSSSLSVFTRCTFNSFTSASTIITGTTSLLNGITISTFISDGSNHAIQINSTGSFNLVGNTFTNYYSGTSPASTGNEVIYNNSGGLVTIYPSGNTGTISYRNSSGSSTVIAATARNFSFTVSPSITGYEWRIYSVTALGSLAGASELAGEEVASISSQTYAYSYIQNIYIAVQILDVNYVESITYYTLIDADQSVSINLTIDTND